MKGQAVREYVGELGKVGQRIQGIQHQPPGDNLAAVAHQLAQAVRGVINGCVHPDKAIRAVMVDLRPLREALAAYDGLQREEHQ